jgi:hypothetical protein
MIEMKRIAVWLFIIGMLFAMAACAAQDPAASMPSPTTDPPGSSGPSKPAMKEPPRLTVSFGEGDTFDAEICGFYWSFANGDGTMSGIKADSPHPLDPQLQLTPIETTESRVELQFEVPPQRISVCCWSDTLIGNTSAPAENASVSGSMLELKPGGYIYEVTAVWNGENLAAEGTVRYVFHLIKHSVQFAHEHTASDASQPTGGEPVAYCGNTVTKILLGSEEHSFMGSDSVNLTDLLMNLNYDPMLVCKCLPDFYVETEFGMTYGISLSGYARCEEGQADLTGEQLALIRQILENQTK